MGWLKDLSEFFNRKLIINGMKGLLFFAPIYLITQDLYLHYFGAYYVKPDLEFFINFVVQQPQKWVFCLFVFGCILGLAIAFEKYIFPFIATIFIGRLPHDFYRRPKVVINTILKRTHGFNPLHFIKHIPKNEFYSWFTLLPTNLILWLIYVNSIWSYLSLAIVLLTMIYFYKILNTVYEEHI